MCYGKSADRNCIEVVQHLFMGLLDTGNWRTKCWESPKWCNFSNRAFEKHIMIYLNVVMPNQDKRVSKKLSDVTFWLISACFSTGQWNGTIYKLGTSCILGYLKFCLWYAQKITTWAHLKASSPAVWNTAYRCGSLSLRSPKALCTMEWRTCACVPWRSAQKRFQHLPQAVSAPARQRLLLWTQRLFV